GGRFGNKLTRLTQIAEPQALGTSAEGAIYVVQFNAGKVSQLDLTNSGRAVVVAQDLNRPTAATGFHGDVYIAEAGLGQVIKVDQLGNKTTVATGLGQITGLAVGPDGTIYASDLAANRIMKATPDGTVSPFADVEGPKQLTVDPTFPR